MKQSKAVKRVINQARQGTIRLWSLQPVTVWESLKKNGQIYVDPNHVDFSGDDRMLILAYDWLRDEMAKRLSGYQGHYPWWAYEHFLDLRFYRHHHFSDTIPAVRLELAVDADEVLLSAYGAWHSVLNRSYLSKSIGDDWEIEYDAWHEKAKSCDVTISFGFNPIHLNVLPEPFETELRQSWANIFDVEARRSTETIQAVFECLRLQDVISVTKFTSVGRHKNSAALTERVE